MTIIIILYDVKLARIVMSYTIEVLYHASKGQIKDMSLMINVYSRQ